MDGHPWLQSDWGLMGYVKPYLKKTVSSKNSFLKTLTKMNVQKKMKTWRKKLVNLCVSRNHCWNKYSAHHRNRWTMAAFLRGLKRGCGGLSSVCSHMTTHESHLYVLSLSFSLFYLRTTEFCWCYLQDGWGVTSRNTNDSKTAASLKPAPAKKGIYDRGVCGRKQRFLPGL